MNGIDVHAHYLPEPILDISRRRGQSLEAFRPGARDVETGLADRLQRMDEAGVRLQVLSPPPMPYTEDEAIAVRETRQANDLMLDAVQRHPDRFTMYVTLPLPHVDASLRELERLSGAPGVLGVTLMCSCMDTSVADARFEPLYAEMNRRKTALFLHPCVNGLCTPLINDYKLAASVGTSLEDTLIVLQMITRRIPERYPHIRTIVPHLGGPLPMLLERLDNQLPAAHPQLPEPPSVTARRFWYDTVGHGSRAALRCAHEAFGADRLVAGSDFPFLLPYESYAKTFAHLEAAGLEDDEIERIRHGNAATLFGLGPDCAPLKLASRQPG